MKNFQARHVFLLLCQFVNNLEVIHLPVYYPSEQEKEDPKLYANNVRKLMAVEVYTFIFQNLKNGFHHPHFLYNPFVSPEILFHAN